MRSLICSAAALALAAAAAPAFADPPCPSGAPIVAQRAGAPPPQVQEVQPPMPAYGYSWTPGYWGWNSVAYDYYWVPGVWVMPPTIGLLWTPPWWGWVGGVYVLTPGYWGPTVGFYGGIDYGFGYGGRGYDGGYWRGRTFYYNRAVNNFGGVRVNAVYNDPPRAGRGFSRVSYNGGAGGVRASATSAELAAARQARGAGTPAQFSHAEAAAGNPAFHADAVRAGGGHLGAVAAGAAGVAAGAVATHAAMHAAANHAATRAAAHATSHSYASHASGHGGGYGGHSYASHSYASHSYSAHAAGGGFHGGGFGGFHGGGGGAFGGFHGGGGGHGGGAPRPEGGHGGGGHPPR